MAKRKTTNKDLQHITQKKLNKSLYLQAKCRYFRKRTDAFRNWLRYYCIVVIICESNMAEVDASNLADESNNIVVDKQLSKTVIDEQKKIATVNCTKRDLKLVYKWFVRKGEFRSIENISPHELDPYLSEFYINWKKGNDQEYEPGTFDGIRASIERHLKDHEYSHSLRDKEFNLSTRALSAKKQFNWKN